ncbi:MAG: DUF167 domain-containing protein [Nitrosopumilaceae archaeon]
MIYIVNVDFNRDFIAILDDKISIGIKSRPIKGEANKEIIKKLSKHFGVSSRNIIIKSGHKSREKIVEILS